MWSKSRIGIILHSFKHIGRLIIRLKIIKYNEDSFCYLSSYIPNLGLQALCLLILFFQLYIFRTLSLAECICSLKFWISDLFEQFKSLFAKSIVNPKVDFSKQLGWSNTRELYLLCLMSHASYYPYGGFKSLRFCIDWGHFFTIMQATSQD